MGRKTAATKAAKKQRRQKRLAARDQAMASLGSLMARRAPDIEVLRGSGPVDSFTYVPPPDEDEDLPEEPKKPGLFSRLRSLFGAGRKKSGGKGGGMVMVGDVRTGEPALPTIDTFVLRDARELKMRLKRRDDVRIEEDGFAYIEPMDEARDRIIAYCYTDWQTWVRSRSRTTGMADQAREWLSNVFGDILTFKTRETRKLRDEDFTNVEEVMRLTSLHAGPSFD